MIKVYVSHPYSDDPVGNVQKARKIVEKIGATSISELVATDNINDENGMPDGYGYESVVCPICPLLTFPDSMSEVSGVSRKHALAFCLALVDSCDELWVIGGALTPGMRDEITRASEKGIPVRWVTDL